MLIDTHMHTRYSTDSEMTLAEAMARSQELGIGITITDHMDLNYPNSGEFVFDLGDYCSEYGPYRSEKLLLGVEFGLRMDCLEATRELAGSYPLDYMIGSIHVINDIDLYWESFYRGHSKQEVYSLYFATMLECVKAHDFIHSLAHIDYISRYARFADTHVYYDEFKEVIDPVLAVLAERGQALEINTKRVLTPEYMALLLPVYRRFAELGGRHVTVGSDAHRASEIGRDMKTAFDFADCCGLRPVYFKTGKPEYQARD